MPRSINLGLKIELFGNIAGLNSMCKFPSILEVEIRKQDRLCVLISWDGYNQRKGLAYISSATYFLAV